MMNWQQLISNKRLGQEHRHPERHDDRTEFKRDYDRLIFSAPFRRLQNKTQVFPLPGSIFVHNRLTHSLEVASVGMSLGNDVAQQLTRRHPELKDTLFQEIGQIVATACLAHDLGNPPFGHSGEKAMQAYFLEGAGTELQREVSPIFWNDLTHFEKNHIVHKKPRLPNLVRFISLSFINYFPARIKSYLRIPSHIRQSGVRAQQKTAAAPNDAAAGFW